jgi:hypothetical protein
MNFDSSLFNNSFGPKPPQNFKEQLHSEIYKIEEKINILDSHLSKMISDNININEKYTKVLELHIEQSRLISSLDMRIRELEKNNVKPVYDKSGFNFPDFNEKNKIETDSDTDTDTSGVTRKFVKKNPVKKPVKYGKKKVKREDPKYFGDGFNGVDGENKIKEKENNTQQLSGANIQSPISGLFPFADNIIIEFAEPANFNPSEFLSSFMKKNDKPKKEEVIEESDDEIIEFDEEDNSKKVEELGIQIKSIDDLISIGNMYVDLKGLCNKKNNEPQIEDNKKKDDNLTETLEEKVKSILQKLGLRDKTAIGKMINNKKINILNNLPNKEEKKEDNKVDNIKNKKISRLYELNGKYYPVNLETIHKLVKPLTKLKSMIGLTKVKDSILDMILYYLQQFEITNKNMLHTVIEGPPGVGKTKLGKIFAEIYSAMGIIPTSKFKIVKRTDLIGEYLGHTAHKTQRAIDEADGGVLFIDEAYSLGAQDGGDSFAKEAIDTLNQNLSEKKKKLIVIIAGYPDELEKSFFSYNPGLDRRFPFRFRIDGYTPEEMTDILLKKVEEEKWKLAEKMADNSEEVTNNSVLVKFFTDNKNIFQNYGGDIDNLLVQTKFCHSRRVVGQHPKVRCIFTYDDLLNGFERFKINRSREIEKRKDKKLKQEEREMRKEKREKLEFEKEDKEEEIKKKLEEHHFTMIV